MNEIGAAFTEDVGGASYNCCFYHQKTSKLLMHDSLKKLDYLRLSRKPTNSLDLEQQNNQMMNTESEDFQIVQMPFPKQ